MPPAAFENWIRGLPPYEHNRLVVPVGITAQAGLEGGSQYLYLNQFTGITQCCGSSLIACCVPSFEKMKDMVFIPFLYRSVIVQVCVILNKL